VGDLVHEDASGRDEAHLGGDEESAADGEPVREVVDAVGN
jgi:hypothetical protein